MKEGRLILNVGGPIPRDGDPGQIRGEKDYISWVLVLLTDPDVNKQPWSPCLPCNNGPYLQPTNPDKPSLLTLLPIAYVTNDIFL